MKAVGYFTPGPIDRTDALVDLDLPEPRLGARDLLVRIKAVSVNPVDGKVRKSAAPVEGEAKVLGWDAAGIVEAAGPEASMFAVGDEVYYAGDLTRAGTNAELHVVDERIVGTKPRTLDFAQAAALPLTSLTAWELLFDRLRVPYGNLRRGGTLLVINGAGGVGSMLIQLARRLTGLTVVATASRPESIAWALSMGAHHVVDHRQPLDAEMLRIGIDAVEYVASLTASEQHLPAIAKLIAPQGHLALIDDPPSFDIVGLKRKSVTVAWELMFTRSLFATPDMIEQHRILDEVSALVDRGVLKTTLSSQDGPINADRLKRLHALVESGGAIGKAVLTGF